MRVAPAGSPCLAPPDTTDEVSAPPVKGEAPAVVVTIERVRGGSPCRVEGANRPPPAGPPAVAPPSERPGFFARLGGAILGRLGSALHGVADAVLGSVIGAGQSLGKAARHAAQGRVGEALLDVARIPFNTAALVAVKALGVVQTMSGLQGPARGLSDDEKRGLRHLYGPGVNLDLIRVVEGGSGLLNTQNNAITLGNTIHVRAGVVLTPELLAHEATHVWQYQHGGTDYLLKALWSQNTQERHLLEPAIERGATWAQLNPEQQGELIEALARTGYPGSGVLNPAIPKAMADEALAAVRAGRGATE